MNPNEAEGPSAGDPVAGSPIRVPLHETLGIRPLERAGGRSRLEYDVAPEHLRTRGILHGGIFATLLDSALGMAAYSVAPEGHEVLTVQLNVNMIRPAREGQSLVATAEVQHHGRRTAVARGELRTRAGALVATGSATFVFDALGR